jgi:hypothetical protein
MMKTLLPLPDTATVFTLPLDLLGGLGAAFRTDTLRRAEGAARQATP